jgi:hypothetical protein
LPEIGAASLIQPVEQMNVSLTKLGSCPIWILVAKPKTVLFFIFTLFILRVKMDFATRINLVACRLLAKSRRDMFWRGKGQDTRSFPQADGGIIPNPIGDTSLSR